MAEPGGSGSDARDLEPTLYEDHEVRRLYFGPEHIQSEMRLDAPDALQLKYTQRMAAFLLFVPKPRHVVIMGLGGGSLTKFCLKALPKARVTTLEINRRVIAMARMFAVPPADARNCIVHEDAHRWLAESGEAFDVVLIDAYTDAGVAGGFADPAFYARLRQRLRPQGLMVANLVAGSEAMRRYHTVIDTAFEGRTIRQRIVPDGNQLLFAFNGARALDWPQLGADAKRLQIRHALDYPAFVRSLRRASHRGPAPDDAGEDEGRRLF